MFIQMRATPTGGPTHCSEGALEYSNAWHTKIFLFLQIKHLVGSACKSDFLVCVSYDSHFAIVFRPCRRSIQYSASKTASYQGVMIIMIIEMPFVLICVSVALLYLSIDIRKGTQLISKQISNNCFLFTRVASIFVQTCKTTHQNVANLSGNILR